MVRILLALCSSLAVSAAKEPVDVSADLAKLIENAPVPGIAAAAVLKGEVVAIGVSGVRKTGAPEKITLDDRFHIGSCTKSMTASLATILVKDGKIRWGSTAADVFPDISLHSQFAKATLRQFLSSTAGVTRDVPGELSQRRAGLLSGSEGRVLLVKEILANQPLYTPGEGWLYSNAGFSIGGAMLERATGKSYETLMQERLFKPLGITTAGFGTPATPGKIDQPYGHRMVKGKLVAIGPGPNGDNPPVISPAGRVHLSIKDFARFASFHLGDVKGGPLDQAQLDDLHHPVFVPGHNEDYACGWTVTSRGWARTSPDAGRGTVFTHNGTNTMNFAVMWLAPERDFAVVVACNSGEGAKACDQAASLLIGKCLAK